MQDKSGSERINIEEEINKLKSRASFFMFFGIAAVVIGFLFFFVNRVFGLISFFCGIILLVISNYQKSKYASMYKNEFVRHILEEFFDDLEFFPEKGITEETLSDTEMIQIGNTYSSNDYISGKYKGIRFEQSDVCIQNIVSTGKTTTVTTYFDGRWMIFDFNKNFAYDMQVRERSFDNAKKSGGFFSSKPKMNEIEMEDAAFGDEFRVYAANEHEAFYILTPQIMESIRILNKTVSGDLMLCFIQNRLHVAVNNNKNAFEPNLFGKLDIAEMRENVLCDIKVITEFVDRLALYNDIYKK